MEAEEKFDLLGAFDGADEFHGCFAARAVKWVGSPDFENEVAPRGAQSFLGTIPGIAARRIANQPALHRADRTRIGGRKISTKGG